MRIQKTETLEPFQTEYGKEKSGLETPLSPESVAYTMSSVECSILIPTYQEYENLLGLADLLNGCLSRSNFEVVFIDDSSPDGTAEMISKLSKIYPNLRLMVRPKRMGLGSAYKDGFKISQGKFIAQMDGDLSHDPQQLHRLLDLLNKADMVVGSRNIPGGTVVGWRWHRKIINRGANFLVNMLLGLGVRDATSGFRVFTRRAFEQIAAKSAMSGFEFQVEALHIARKLGFNITEAPITFTDRRKGQSKLNGRDVFQFFKAIIQLRQRRFEANIKVQPLKLSVIAPCLNEEKHIDYFLSSIFKQTHQPKEILIIDGGSCDGTVERVIQWQKRHPSLRLIREAAANPGQQRNRGARFAQGDVLLFLDSDTHFSDDPRLFERIVDHFNDPNVFGVYGITKQYDCSRGVKLTYMLYHALRLILNRIPFPVKRYLTSSSFISVKREVFDVIGGFKSTSLIAEDGVFGEKLCHYARESGHQCVLDKDLQIWHNPTAFTQGWFKAIRYYLYIIPYVIHFLHRPLHNITVQSENEFRARSLPDNTCLKIKKYYQTGEFYDWVSSPKGLEKIFHRMRERTIANVVEKHHRNSVVLDAGCGTGLITRHLRGDLIVGLDINRWNLERLAKRSQSVDVVIGDVEHLPIRGSSIDTIVCTDVMEHLPNPRNVIKGYVHALKQHGVVIGSVPSKNPLWKFRRVLSATCPASEPFHRSYSVSELDRLLEPFHTRKIFTAVFKMSVLFVLENPSKKA